MIFTLKENTVLKGKYCDVKITQNCISVSINKILLENSKKKKLKTRRTMRMQQFITIDSEENF